MREFESRLGHQFLQAKVKVQFKLFTNTPSPPIIETSLDAQVFVSAIVEQIKLIRSEDPLERITVVVPFASRYYSSGMYMKNRVTDELENGLFNVEFFGLRDISKQLGLAYMHRIAKIALDKIEDIELVRQSCYTHGWKRSNYRKLYDFFMELEKLNPKDLARILEQESDNQRITHFLSYTRLKNEQSSRFTVQDREQAAAKMAENPKILKSELGYIITLVISNPTYSHASNTVYKSLMQHSKAIIVTTDNVSPPLILLPENCKVSKFGIKTLRPQTKLFAAVSRSDEVRSVIRSIFSLVKSNIRPDQIAVLYEDTTYTQQICDELDAVGIPYNAPAISKLIAHPIGRFVETLITMAETNLSKSSFIKWLSTAPVYIDPTAYTISSVPAICRLIVHELIPSDETTDEHWENRLASSESAVIGFISELRKSLKTKPSSYKEFAEWLRSMCIKYLPVEIRDKKTNASDKFSDLLDSFTRINSSTDISLTQFKDTLLDEIENWDIAADNSNRNGVFVSHYRNAVGCIFEAVHILGMTDSVFPSISAQSRNILHKWIKKTRNIALLDRDAEQILQQRVSFYTALQSAPNRFLYWNLSPSEGGSHDMPPSVWFIKEAQNVSKTDSNITVEDMLNFRHPVNLIDNYLKTDEFSSCSDVWDLDITLALNGPRDDKYTHKVKQQLTRDFSCVKHAIRLLESRRMDRITEFDGRLSSKSKLLNLLKSRPLSATALEKYAKCPMKYFFEYVLSIPRCDKDPLQTTVSPLEFGTLVHRILKEFVTDRDTSADENTQIQALSAIVDANIEQESKNGQIWDVEKPRIMHSLHNWLSKDIEHLKQGWIPSETEFDIRTDLKIGDTTVTLRGVIDRLDKSATGKYFVIDYKTGLSKIKNGDLSTGETIQVALYMYAISGLWNVNPSELEGAYWFILSDSKTSNFSLVESQEDLKNIVTTIYNVILGGMFPARANDSCRVCDFKRICPPSEYIRQSIWKRKMSDIDIQQYVIMKEKGNSS